MKYRYEIATAGLVHDIGKLYQKSTSSSLSIEVSLMSIHLSQEILWTSLKTYFCRYLVHQN